MEFCKRRRRIWQNLPQKTVGPTYTTLCKMQQIYYTTQRCVYNILVAYAQLCLIRFVYNKSIAFYTTLYI